jgi:tetraacyldisaccharide 4'-kinase
MTAWIAQRLAERERVVGILTRGYRGRPVRFSDETREDAASQWRVESDEASLLARLCPKAIVVIDPDRVAGAERAASRGAEVLVLDDGFQHRRLARDLDIVLIDATAAFGFGYALPRGLLREPLRSLRRAGLIILTRSDLVSDEKRRRLVEAVQRMSGGRPVIAARHRIPGFADLKGRPIAEVDARAMQAVLFAGLGHFDPFRESIERLGATVVAAYQYPDHHDYSDEEISQLNDVCSQLDANALITTEKDAVKLVGRWPDGPAPLLTARLAIEFDAADAEVLGRALDEALSGRGGGQG